MYPIKYVRFGSLADICNAKRCPLYPPKADMCGALTYVCFGPIADIGGCYAGCNQPHCGGLGITRLIVVIHDYRFRLIRRDVCDVAYLPCWFSQALRTLN